MVVMKKNYYMTKCEGCNTKFVFDDSDIGVTDDDKFVTCPKCNKRILEYEDYYISSFKKISYRKYS